MDYNAFGGLQGGSGWYYGFTGREYDHDTGLNYHRHRWLDSQTGRWVNEDPIGFFGGDANLNRYSTNSPANSVDPDGLKEVGYWEGVGEVFVGYWGAAVGTAKGAYFVFRHPIQTAQGVGTALRHPIVTAQAICDDVREKSGTLRGQGEIVGDVFIGVATGGALKAVSKSATVAKATQKLESVAEKSALVARILAKIDLYPKVIDPRTGRHIPFPSAIKNRVADAERITWDSKSDRATFIAEWHGRGYETPRAGWDKCDIHHIQPREFGGSNDFWNLVPVERTTHQKLFNEFWREFTGL
jgi:RHS repeat-associated protein